VERHETFKIIKRHRYIWHTINQSIDHVKAKIPDFHPQEYDSSLWAKRQPPILPGKQPIMS
jgi:hypothetical protein